MIAGRSDYRLLEQDETSGRRLRNLIILANAGAWVLIAAAICAIFF